MSTPNILGGAIRTDLSRFSGLGNIKAMPEVAGLAPFSKGVSPAQVDLLKRMISDPDFRVGFINDPITAVVNAKIKITADELASMEKINAEQFDAIGKLVHSTILNAADGTHTLAYAVAFAVVVALLLA